MTETFHGLSNVIEVGDASELTIPRAKALLDAVQQQRFYTLIQIFRHPKDGEAKLECLVVDVECDDVPPENAAGIKYRERLALCVPNDPTQLIEVLALRQNFPVLMHQNHGDPDTPASLCLYFESPAVVRRTWTPQAFLRRIQWWLEKSARGDLHPADQPLEHLFFASPYELVLPWNLSELRQRSGVNFSVVQRQEHPGGGFTYFLEPASGASTQPKTVKHIELTLPPVVHGFIERDPVTLGKLADSLERRGVDLIGPIRDALQQGIGDAGSPASADQGTVILLHIPVCRELGAKPSGIVHRAFLVPVNTLDLGVDCGALMLHDKRYYVDWLSHDTPVAWRTHPVLPMDVLRQNDAAAARRQSGISDEGPKGVMVGAGSLGSALLNLWGRSGWGRWTVIDKDHIKPHNLARHSAYTQHIGAAKATAVAELHAAATDGATQIRPVVADACNLDQTDVQEALADAELVVDASTTLEFPRSVSDRDALPRQISVFITPNGNAAVLMAEDAARLQRLRTLEAQYYRALIQQDWGRSHFGETARTFWSGASCRDISLVLPYSRIMAHASTLAEQVPFAVASEDARIRVWQRDTLLGGVDAHEVAVEHEKRFALGDIDLYIDYGAEKQLRELRERAAPNETGGVLLGYYDFNIHAAVVVAGLPAPPDSQASPTSFERGVEGVVEAVTDAATRTMGMVGYIGEWHSHPPGADANPSRSDIEQLVYLTLGMADDGLPAVQLIVGEADTRVLQGVAALSQ